MTIKEFCLIIYNSDRNTNNPIKKLYNKLKVYRWLIVNYCLNKLRSFIFECKIYSKLSLPSAKYFLMKISAYFL